MTTHHKWRFTLAPARASDLNELRQLLQAAVPDCHPRTVADLLRSIGSYHVVCDEDGSLIGGGALLPADGGRLEIRGITVDLRCRGRGIASAVVDHLRARAAERGCAVVCVTRRPSFFQRLGFRPVAPTWLPVDRRPTPSTDPARRVTLAAPRLVVAA